MHVILTKLAVVLLAHQLCPSLIGNICTLISILLIELRILVIELRILVIDTHLQSFKVVITTRMHLFPYFKPCIWL